MAETAQPPAPRILGHPPGLFVLSFAEMWERFSFYGMKGLLVFYLTKNFGFGDDASYTVMGTYGGLVYATPFFGGMLADKFLGYRKAVTWGGICFVIGHILMTVENISVVYLALAFLIAGNGFFKPNISTIVGKLYGEKDPGRESGFFFFYMGINLGAFLGGLLAGWIGDKIGYHYGFGLAAIGMVAGLAVFSRFQGYLEQEGFPPHPDRLKQRVLPGINLEWSIYLGTLAVIGAVWYIVQTDWLVKTLLYGTCSLAFIYLLIVAFSQEKTARDRMLAALVLIAFSVLFWSCYELDSSSINLFTERNVDREVFGLFEIPAPSLQSVNPGFVIVFSLLFSLIFMRLAARKRDISTPAKFSIGIILLGVGFGVLALGAALAGGDGLVSLGWLVFGYYLIKSLGELFLSPVGLSMITKLSPKKMTGTMMGMWFLFSALSEKLAGEIAKFTSVKSFEGEIPPPVETVGIYGGLYLKIFFITGGVGLILLLLVPLIKKWMHGVE